MKLFGKTSTLIAGSLAAVCAAGAVAAYTAYQKKTEEVVELQERLDKLAKKETRSAIMQSVNAQMEEIALQERHVSDQQREAAEEQTKVAEQMRQNAEVERQNALEAEHRALDASEVAKSQRTIAEQQRTIAEQQRTQAEFSKRVADTLSFITLARQLGNVATTQHQGGNRELADLMAYTSYLYTNRYRGDVYYPTVYQALQLTSQSRHQWNRHKGTVTDIAFTSSSKERLVTCSSYGELLRHSLTGNQLKTDTIFSDSKYDFRDVYVVRDNNTIYAVSRTGQLVILLNGKTTILNVNGIGALMGFEPVNDQMIVIGERGIALFDAKNQQIVKTRELPYKGVFVTRYDNAPIIFDNQGYMHIIRSIEKTEDKRVPVNGQVTAFASSKSTGYVAYGMKNGTIYLFDANGKSKELVGHQSRISFLKIDGRHVYSSSYDGTLNFWMNYQKRTEHISILKTNNWITSFTFDPQKENIWCGDQNGNLTEEFINVDLMVKRIKGNLKRNLTKEEWDYYIGQNIPYERFIGKETGR